MEFALRSDEGPFSVLVFYECGGPEGPEGPEGH